MGRQATIWEVRYDGQTISNIHSETEAHRIAREHKGAKVSSVKVTLDSKGRYRQPGGYGRG
jgi:hypothetical protein